MYAISNFRIVHVSWEDVQWNVLFNDTMQIKQGPRADEYYDYGLPPNWTRLYQNLLFAVQRGVPGGRSVG